MDFFKVLGLTAPLIPFLMTLRAPIQVSCFLAINSFSGHRPMSLSLQAKNLGLQLTVLIPAGLTLVQHLKFILPQGQ